MGQYYKISEQYHEKKETYIYVLRLLKKVDKDEFSTLREYAKDYDGYYSSYRGVNGFVFQTEEDAESFAAILDTYFDTSCNGLPIEEVTEEKIVSEQETTKETKKIRPRIKSAFQDGDNNPTPIAMGSGTPLHVALKKIIQTEGESIISEARLVNILDDFHAYDALPSSKYILRAIIAEGFSLKLLCIGEWNDKVTKLVDKFILTTGFETQYTKLIFQSLGFGLGWIKEVDVFSKPSPEVETKLKNIPSSLATEVFSRKKVSNTKKHLEFKGIEICGHPVDFENKLIALGFETGVWCEDFFTMKGKFAGVPNCEIWIHFYAGENIVYKVKVKFQWYQDRKRVANDYKKLKKSLQELYGIPQCSYEDFTQDWTSTYTSSKGFIKLIGFPGNCPQVCIEYYDGYYDKHHGEIDHDTAILDL